MNHTKTKTELTLDEEIDLIEDLYRCARTLVKEAEGEKATDVYGCTIQLPIVSGILLSDERVILLREEPYIHQYLQEDPDYITQLYELYYPVSLGEAVDKAVRSYRRTTDHAHQVVISEKDLGRYCEDKEFLKICRKHLGDMYLINDVSDALIALYSYESAFREWRDE